MDSTPATQPHADAVRERVQAAGLVIERAADGTSDGFWAYAPYMDELELPAQGFKLHVSATIVNATEVADRLWPVLMERRIAFKCVSSLALLTHLNQGTWGLTQVGKFMTVYPVSDAAAVALAHELHHLLADLDAPTIPSDYPLAAGSLVHYRFGVIAGHAAEDGADPDVSSLRLADGSLVPDTRDPRVPVPEWVEDPFTRDDAEPDPAPDTLFAGRFVVHEVLRQRGKGGVYRALEIDPQFVAAVAGGAPLAEDADASALTRPVILKEGRRAGEMERSGADAVARLHWQKQLLEELADDPRFPAAFDVFEFDGNHYLVMEELRGPSLASWLLEHEADAEQALAWTCELAELVATLHGLGVAWSDLSPDNVILAGDAQLLSAADLEHCVRADGPPASEVGTPGFYPRAIAPDCATPRFARDLYAIGAILHTLLSGDWFREQGRAGGGDGWQGMWERPQLPDSCPADLRLVVERLTAIDSSVDAAHDAPAYTTIAQLQHDLAGL